MPNGHGIDMDKIQIGDKVHIEITVKNKQTLLLQSDNSFSFGWFDYAQVVKHIPKPKPEPKIGDTVTVAENRKATIRGINPHEFWLEIEGRDGYITLPKSVFGF